MSTHDNTGLKDHPPGPIALTSSEPVVPGASSEPPVYAADDVGWRKYVHHFTPS